MLFKATGKKTYCRKKEEDEILFIQSKRLAISVKWQQFGVFMKPASKLQFSVLAAAAFAAALFYAIFVSSVPLWDSYGSSNATTPSSPATYNPNQNYSFQINWTDANNALSNAT